MSIRTKSSETPTALALLSVGMALVVIASKTSAWLFPLAFALLGASLWISVKSKPAKNVCAIVVLVLVAFSVFGALRIDYNNDLSGAASPQK